MRKFNFAGSIEQVDHKKACMQLRNQMFHPVLKYLPVILIWTGVCAVTATNLLARFHDVYTPAWLFYGIVAICIFACLWAISYQSRRMWDAMKTNPSRKGQTVYQFSDQGMTYRNALPHGHVAWGGFVGVAETPEAVLLQVGDLEYIPVPADFFADKTERQAFVAQAENWIETARTHK